MIRAASFLTVLIIIFTFGERCVWADKVDFNRDVRPILADNCYECHGPDEKSRRGEYRLDKLDQSVGTTILPGKADESLLIQRLVSHNEDEVMPPPESKRRPTKDQIETLRKWIQQGANYEQHWAFVAPKRADVPKVSNSKWTRNKIDAFVLAHLQSNQLKPSPDADSHTLARRLSLVLTGLPVFPERGDQFARAYANDPEQAISEFVDELLTSKAYGEHLAWTWLDAARYADTNGYQADGFRIMWPWRDWLINTLNENMPFDKMTEQMLAGDLLIPKEQQNWKSADWIKDEKSSDLLIATGFLRNHRYDTGSGTIPAEAKFQNAADRMETVGTVWMGLTMLCARCHTHKYDPIENHEYYELLSFFDNVPEVGAALKRASHPYIRTPTAELRQALETLSVEYEHARDLLKKAKPEIVKAQSAWESELVKSSETIIRVTRGLKFQYAKPAIKFDGKNSIEKTNQPVALCAGSKKWTISFWFRPESESSGAIFSSVEEPERYRPGIQADWVDGKVRVRHVCRWVNSYIEFESREKLNLGQWYHVSFSSDGQLQGIAYQSTLDGRPNEMICTHPVTNDSAERGGKAPLLLGGSPFLPGMIGMLHDLRFYNRSLDTSEIHSLADSRDTKEIAKIPKNSRTEIESKTLSLAFIESDLLPQNIRNLREKCLELEEKLEEEIRKSPTTMVMKEGNTETTRVRLAGVYDSYGAEVKTSTPEFLPSFSNEKRSRLALARWLMHPEHPLTARVAVNRIWQLLWGHGFVDSPENFGTQCAKPLNAELLDWLATEYVRLNWDTKALIKLMVTSRAFRQSSNAPESMWKRDPQNRHLSRGPRFRLPVHAVRDQALYLSGRLDDTIGGPPVIIDKVLGQNGKPMRLPYEKSQTRRTLYTFWKRNSPHPMLAVFDVADRNQCEVRTMRTNTPLQALVTLNESGFASCAEALAKRARKGSEYEIEQLQWCWQACTGRKPNELEMKRLKNILSEYRSITNQDDDKAWTALCNVLLNLDATLTLE